MPNDTDSLDYIPAEVFKGFISELAYNLQDGDDTAYTVRQLVTHLREYHANAPHITTMLCFNK